MSDEFILNNLFDSNTFIHMDAWKPDHELSPALYKINQHNLRLYIRMKKKLAHLDRAEAVIKELTELSGLAQDYFKQKEKENE